MKQVKEDNFSISYLSNLNEVKNFSKEEHKEIEDFLLNITKEFAKESFKFYKEWNEFPFVYREKQVYSALIPAIYKHTQNIFLEQPFKSVNNKQRFLDIVTSFKENIYFIELKHSYKSKQNYLRDETIDKWKNAIKQIGSIKKDNIGLFYEENFKQYKIALMIMPYFISPYQTINKADNNIQNKTLNLFKDKNIFTKSEYANYISTIEIKNYSKFIHYFYKEREEVYPFLFFVARVEKVV